MRVITLVLAYLAVAMARPQFRLTEKEYEGFQAGLDGRIPVAITSGQLLYSAVDESPNNFVVVDFGGAGPAAPRIPGVGDSGEVGAGINDFGQGVLAFGQGVVQFASQAVGDIVDGIGQVAEDTFALLGSGEDDFDRSLIDAPPQLPLDVADVEARAVIIVDDTAGAPISVDESAAVAAGINDFGQGVLAFGQGVAAFASQAVGDLGQVAEDTLQGIADLVGDERSFAAGRAGGVPLPLDVIAAEPRAVIVLDALPEAALPDAPVDIEKSAVVPATDLLSAPAAVEDVAAVPIAESRSAPVAAEDIAVAPVAPEEAIVAPPAPVAVGVALIRRKRQFVDAEEPISNAKSIGTGLGTGFGLFGSTVGRFLDSTAAAFVEMIDGLEGLGTITLDQIENSFDDDPNNDFIRR